jgi:hypothetical protein
MILHRCSRTCGLEGTDSLTQTSTFPRRRTRRGLGPRPWYDFYFFFPSLTSIMNQHKRNSAILHRCSRGRKSPSLLDRGASESHRWHGELHLHRELSLSHGDLFIQFEIICRSSRGRGPSRIQPVLGRSMSNPSYGWIGSDGLMVPTDGCKCKCEGR